LLGGGVSRLAWPPSPVLGGGEDVTGFSAKDKRLMLIALLLTVASGAAHSINLPNLVPFFVSMAALASLAALVGLSVERLGDRLGAGLTGAVQAALGNLPELCVGIFALRAGLLGVVQSALVGSVVANLSLVLGLSFVVGGVKHGTQKFAPADARNMALMLLLAVSIIAIPSISSYVHATPAHHAHTLSTIAVVILLGVFVVYSWISLRQTRPPTEPVDPSNLWPLKVVVFVLLFTATAAAFVSSWFIDALSPVLRTFDISQYFAGLVIVALAGNAVENFVSLQLAAKNKMDYVLSITIQSPLQIVMALFPALVLISYMFASPALTLVLPPMLLVALMLSALIASFAIIDGESNVIEGVSLVALYLMIAAAFWWG